MWVISGIVTFRHKRRFHVGITSVLQRRNIFTIWLILQWEDAVAPTHCCFDTALQCAPHRRRILDFELQDIARSKRQTAHRDQTANRSAGAPGAEATTGQTKDALAGFSDRHAKAAADQARRNGQGAMAAGKQGFLARRHRWPASFKRRKPFAFLVLGPCASNRSRRSRPGDGLRPWRGDLARSGRAVLP